MVEGLRFARQAATSRSYTCSRAIILCTRAIYVAHVKLYSRMQLAIKSLGRDEANVRSERKV